METLAGSKMRMSWVKSIDDMLASRAPRSNAAGFADGGSLLEVLGEPARGGGGLALRFVGGGGGDADLTGFAKSGWTGCADPAPFVPLCILLRISATVTPASCAAS